jgi:hypothetical protein
MGRRTEYILQQIIVPYLLPILFCMLQASIHMATPTKNSETNFFENVQRLGLARIIQNTSLVHNCIGEAAS